MSAELFSHAPSVLNSYPHCLSASCAYGVHLFSFIIPSSAVYVIFWEILGQFACSCLNVLCFSKRQLNFCDFVSFKTYTKTKKSCFSIFPVLVTYYFGLFHLRIFIATPEMSFVHFFVCARAWESLLAKGYGDTNNSMLFCLCIYHFVSTSHQLFLS